MPFDLSVSEIEDLSPQEIVELVQEKVEPIIEKRDELLGEKKEVKSKLESKKSELKELRATVEEIDPDSMVDEEKLEEVKEDVKSKYEQQLEEERDEKTELKSKLERQMIESELTEALTEAGVADPYVGPLKSKLRSELNVVEDDGEFVVVAGDDPTLGQDPGEVVDEYLDDNGRDYYTEAPSNSGGGAGSETDGGGSTNGNPLDKASDDYNFTNANKFMKQEDPEKVRRLLEEAEEPIRDPAKV